MRFISLDNLQRALQRIQEIQERFGFKVDNPNSSFNEVLKGVQNSNKTSSIPKTYYELIQQASEEFQIDANLIRAICLVESNFNPSATSPKGAMGLMQLMPETAKELGIHNPYDPKENIWGGVRYFKSLLQKYDGNLELALAAYNAGPGSVEKYNGIPPYPETQNFVKNVLEYFKEFSRIDLGKK